MARFVLKMTCDNAAFCDGALTAEVTRILRDAARRVERDNMSGQLRDINGNTVGEFTFSGKFPA